MPRRPGTIHLRAVARVAVPLLLAAVALLALAGAAQAQTLIQTDIPGPPGSGKFGEQVVVLPNGNFVVADPLYDAPGAANAGAVSLYDGDTLALISRLTGSTANDSVGFGGVAVLANGPVVVISPLWDDGGAPDVGAVTWMDATTGLTGTVSATNSLVGGTQGDFVGDGGVTVLANGHYVVSSAGWNGGRGAVTWANGATGLTGTVSASNSLVGSAVDDAVGSDGVTALANGNYVVISLFWNQSRGAVTWGSGTAGIAGAVSAANSLVGSAADDMIGFGGVTPLANGHYVVSSPNWNEYRGAATWGSGTAGRTGTVSAANSLVGSTANDGVGYTGVTALANGNYVVISDRWNGNIGAVTWGSGTAGIAGTVSASNSLVGSTVDDRVGSDGVTALANGNYVVSSPGWDGSAVDTGAATWGSGTAGITGPVTTTNSLAGSAAADSVGRGGVTALANGSYVVGSPDWNGGRGAVTWGSGAAGIAGTVSAANSLVGGAAGAIVGSGGVTALSNGNYVVRSPNWDGAAANTGAVTWGSGTTGITGTVSAANSLVGSKVDDAVGSGGTTALADGAYAVKSDFWDGSATDTGAITWGRGETGVTGPITTTDSVFGTAAGGGDEMTATFNLLRGYLIVGRPADARVTVAVDAFDVEVAPAGTGGTVLVEVVTGTVQAGPVQAGTVEMPVRVGAVDETYPVGTVLRLTALPFLGYAFESWGGDATGSANPLEVTVAGPLAITAAFVVADVYLPAVSK